jgi:hypothetical protein
MNAVNHLSYAHVGNEPLEELQAICNPCHEYISGKRDIDPLGENIGVYLAGPIRANDWRRELFVGYDHWKHIPGYRGPNVVPEAGEESFWPTIEHGLVGGFDFCGPFFISELCEHGGARWGRDHAWLLGHRSEDGVDGEPSLFIERLRQVIRATDILFVWLPEGIVSGGTILEVGMAYALGKTIVWADNHEYLCVDPGESEPDECNLYPSHLDDPFWLAKSCAWLSIHAPNAREAFDKFLKESLPSVMAHVLRKQFPFSAPG